MLCEEMYSMRLEFADASLNPCYSGICSVSLVNVCQSVFSESVLILVIVEYAL